MNKGLNGSPPSFKEGLGVVIVPLLQPLTFNVQPPNPLVPQ